MFKTKRVLRNHYTDHYRTIALEKNDVVYSIVKDHFKHYKVNPHYNGSLRISNDPVVDIIFSGEEFVSFRAQFVIEEQCPLFWSTEVRRTCLKHDINDFFETLNKTRAFNIRVKYLTGTYVTLTLSGKIKITKASSGKNIQ